MAVSYETVRRWGEPFRTNGGGRPAKAWPQTSIRLGIWTRLSENRRPNGLPLGDLDAEGEVLDVLVQSKRNKHAFTSEG